MEPLQIAQRLKSIFPDHVHSVEEFREQYSVTVSREKIVEICRYLQKEPEFSFDFLVDLCGVDHLGRKQVRFEVVYHLYSIKNKERLRLKAPVPEDDCRIASVMPVWIGANWHERECYDLFGIVFEGHPDMRRILLPEDWEGYPLRKDYPLKGPAPDHEWKGFKEVLELSKKTREFEWNK